MKFEQLETFVWLAKLRSFRAAANQLNASQPGISLRIQRLEDELGARLFERTQRLISLTAAGRECLAYAEQIVAWKEELRGRAAMTGQVRGRINLGVSELIAHTWLSTLLTTLAERHPGLRVDPTIDLTPRLLADLDNGEFDVILVGSWSLTTVHPVLELGSARFHWMGRPSSDAEDRPLTPSDLQHRQIITWPKQAAVHRFIRDWFVAHSAYPEEMITCNSAMTMAAMAAAGLGVSLLPPAVVERELAERRLIILPVEPEFEPLPYKAVFPRRAGWLGELVAHTAREVSTFEGAAA